jgi:hypothetical protein
VRGAHVNTRPGERASRLPASVQVTRADPWLFVDRVMCGRTPRNASPPDVEPNPKGRQESGLVGRAPRRFRWIPARCRG